MKLTIVGDSHGEHRFVRTTIDYAHRNGSQKIFIVGDFGLDNQLPSDIAFLDMISLHGNQRGVDIYALPGNHENYDSWEWYLENFPKDSQGFTYIRHNLKITPKVHFWEWDNTKFATIGGAASVDKDWRLREDGLYGGKSWWHQELLVDADIDAIDPTKPVDVVLSHDASNDTPWGFKLIPDMQSLYNRQLLDRGLNKLKPERHFHGHMHRKYEWLRYGYTPEGEAFATETIGLECNGMQDAFGILNTEDMSWEWGKYE